MMISFKLAFLLLGSIQVVDGFSVVVPQQQQASTSTSKLFFKKADQDNNILSVEILGGGSKKILDEDDEDYDDDDDHLPHHEAVRTSYHKGGSQYKPVVDPTKLHDDADEECEEIYTDQASGDELCWLGEAILSPTAHLEQIEEQVGLRRNTVPLHARIETQLPKDPMSKSYQKGGTRAQPVVNPTRLSDEHEDGDCDGEPYFDFPTGDELCWSI